MVTDKVLGRRTQLLSSPLTAWDFIRRWPVIAVAIIVILAISAIFAPLVAPHDPRKADLRAREIPPVWSSEGSADHLLGTDQLGRDILSRIIHGSRISLMVASIALLTGLLVGSAMGIVAGYFGGLLDEVIMRLVDLWLALPFLLIALVVAVVVGPSLTVVIWLLALSSWSTGARNVRGDVLHIKTTDYVSWARIAGASDLRIMARHILPQVMHILIVITTLRIGGLIIAEAGLSFLGIGVPALIPTWGIMVSEGREHLLTSWWIAIFPGLAIFITVMAFNFLGDWVRDRLDPRLRQL